MSYQIVENEEATEALRLQMAEKLDRLAPVPFFLHWQDETPYELTGSVDTLRALSALLVRMKHGESDGCRFIFDGPDRARRLVRVKMTRRGLQAAHGRCLILREALLVRLMAPAPRDGLAAQFITLTKVQWLCESALGLSLPVSERVRLF